MCENLYHSELKGRLFTKSGYTPHYTSHGLRYSSSNSLQSLLSLEVGESIRINKNIVKRVK